MGIFSPSILHHAAFTMLSCCTLLSSFPPQIPPNLLTQILPVLGAAPTLESTSCSPLTAGTEAELWPANLKPAQPDAL